MKFYHKLLIISILLFFVWSIVAQNLTTQKIYIQWNGVQNWKAPKASRSVLAFENATYLYNDTYLPYWTRNYQIPDGFDYNFTLENETLVKLTPAESKLVEMYQIPTSLEVKANKTYSSGNSFINIELLPLVKRKDGVYRLKSFEIVPNRTVAKQLSKPTNSRHSYVQNSILASGKFTKISIKESGIYKLTYEQLKAMGIEPQNVRIFGYGGALLDEDFMKNKIDDLPEVAIWMEKGNDGVFNQGDYILFYAQGVVKWNYDNQNKRFVHTINHYANEGYYFVTSDLGIGKRIENRAVDTPQNANITDITYFNDYQVHEKETRNLGQTGQVFYGEEFRTVTSYDIPFVFPNIDKTSKVKVHINAAVNATVESLISLSLADVESYSINTERRNEGDFYEIGKELDGKLNYQPINDVLNFTVKYDKPNQASVAYLNYIEVNAKRKLKMVDNLLYFRNAESIKANSNVYNRYKIENANAALQVWDITDQSNIFRVASELKGDILEFVATGSELREYAVIDPKAEGRTAPSPTIKNVVPNQNLHAIGQTDYLIITYPEFLQQAKKLAQAHREINNLTVNVVTTEQVYNEFSSGTPDGTAYRWMLKMLYDRALASGDKSALPKYLLLFGRGSYDNRGIIVNSGDNLLLTYQAKTSLNLVNSYVTDDYFGLLDDNEGTELTSDAIDIGIGRFPVTTVTQAEDVVNKTIKYMSNDILGKWKNELCFIGDDGDNALHVIQIDNIASMLMGRDNSYHINKIYLDAFKQEVSAEGARYPTVNTAIKNLLHSGVLLLNFMGHASPLGLTHEHVLMTKDIKKLSNEKLPLWMAATCDLLEFDVNTVSAGEYILLNPNGGGIGLYSAARTVYAGPNEALNRAFTLFLFDKENGKYPRVGDAIKHSKRTSGNGVNKLSYMLFGDPAIRLLYPDDYNIKTEKINDKTVTGEEVFNALSVQKISGSIADDNGDKVSDFNGQIEMTVYDKKQKITTLNNKKDGGFYTYVDRPNIIFSGKSDVVNGDFLYEFIVPRDIKYNFGKGKIYYYAYDPTTRKEVRGVYNEFAVGGSNSNYDDDVNGPKVEMYLNTDNFKTKDKVNETPLFVANIADRNGINTVGSGIGHDLKLVIDNRPESTYILNEYFESDKGSYSDGVVKFKIPALNEGKHTLRFHAWDLLNNSTTKSFEFEVVNGLEPVIFNVSNYPNPIKEKTTFIVEHDRPETILEMKVDVYDVTGRLVFTNVKYSSNSVDWDAKDSSGCRVSPGFYIYKVSIKTDNSNFTSKSNKIIVTEQ